MAAKTSAVTETHTIQTVRAFLLSQRESDEPDEVLAILKAHDGKPFTKRILAKLPGGTKPISGMPIEGQDRWTISQFATMTHLETRDYRQTGGNTGIHLLMAYATTSVTINAAWVEENNPGYFKGRRERNAQRDNLTNGFTRSTTLELMADRLNAYEDAKMKLDEAKKQLDALTETLFAADSYDWECLCGAREDKRP
jgi:hypothetical protein